MNPNTEPASAEQLRELARIGFLAVHVGEPAAARAIFTSLMVLRPDSVLPHIGRALAEQAAGRMEEAVRWLRDEGLRQHPDDPELTAFLGLALVQAGWSSQATPLLRRVARLEPEAGAHVRMARELLDQAAPPAGMPAPRLPTLH